MVSNGGCAVLATRTSCLHSLTETWRQQVLTPLVLRETDHLTTAFAIQAG